MNENCFIRIAMNFIIMPTERISKKYVCSMEQWQFWIFFNLAKSFLCNVLWKSEGKKKPLKSTKLSIDPAMIFVAILTQQFSFNSDNGASSYGNLLFLYYHLILWNPIFFVVKSGKIGRISSDPIDGPWVPNKSYPE